MFARDRLLRCIALMFVLAWAWSVAGPARAAAPIPRVEDGAGLKVGQRSTFHAGFALPLGLDSNVFIESRREGPRVAAFIYPSAWIGIGNREVRDGLLMTPAERSGRVLDYNIALLAGFRQFLARDVVIRSQPRFSIGTQIRLSILPARRFSIDVAEDFFRGGDPGNLEIPGNRFNFNRIDHHGQLRFVARPGGGRLALMVGYRNAILLFGSPELFRANRMVNGLMHETRWRFLPRSSLFFNYTFDRIYYTHCCAETNRGRNEDSYQHRLTGGYRGQLLDKLVFDATLGWGFGYYRDDASGPNFNSFIGSAGVSYFPTLRSMVHGSVYRDFQDSLWGNYYVDNGARVALRHVFAWRMIARLGLAAAARTYHGVPGPDDDGRIVALQGRGASERQQRGAVFSLDAGAEQPLGRLFSLGLSYTLSVHATDFRVTYVGGPPNELGYVRNLLWLMAAVRI